MAYSLQTVSVILCLIFNISCAHDLEGIQGSSSCFGNLIGRCFEHVSHTLRIYWLWSHFLNNFWSALQTWYHFCRPVFPVLWKAVEDCSIDILTNLDDWCCQRLLSSIFNKLVSFRLCFWEWTVNCTFFAGKSCNIFLKLLVPLSPPHTLFVQETVCSKFHWCVSQQLHHRHEPILYMFSAYYTWI